MVFALNTFFEKNVSIWSTGFVKTNYFEIYNDFNPSLLNNMYGTVYKNGCHSEQYLDQQDAQKNGPLSKNAVFSVFQHFGLQFSQIVKEKF